MNTNQYVDLIDFRLSHDFYTKEEGSVFQLQPTVYTKDLFKRYNILYKHTPWGFRLNIKENFKVILTRDVLSNLLESFTFNISPKNKDLVKVSSLKKNGISDYYTLHVDLKTKDIQWGVEKTVVKNANPFLAINTNVNPWALLCLNFNQINVTEASSLLKINAKLESRKVFWKYVVVDSKSQFSEISILGNNDSVQFGAPKEVHLSDGTKAFEFISSQQIESKSRYSNMSFELELIKIMDGSRRKSSIALPFPSLKDFKYQQNSNSDGDRVSSYVAQMSVYL